jgi:hypothetical protein
MIMGGRVMAMKERMKVVIDKHGGQLCELYINSGFAILYGV